jgi:hypothetical protein
MLPKQGIICKADADGDFPVNSDSESGISDKYNQINKPGLG